MGSGFFKKIRDPPKEVPPPQKIGDPKKFTKKQESGFYPAFGRTHRHDGMGSGFFTRPGGGGRRLGPTQRVGVQKKSQKNESFFCRHLAGPAGGGSPPGGVTNLRKKSAWDIPTWSILKADTGPMRPTRRVPAGSRMTIGGWRITVSQLQKEVNLKLSIDVMGVSLFLKHLSIFGHSVFFCVVNQQIFNLILLVYNLYEYEPWQFTFIQSFEEKLFKGREGRFCQKKVGKRS